MTLQLPGAQARPAAAPAGLGPVAAGAIGAAAAVGVLSAVAGSIAVVLAVAAGLVCLVAWRPVLAAYLYLATLPFIAGIERGSLLPLLRPNEALLVLFMIGVGSGCLIRGIRGEPVQLRLSRWDVPVAAFFVLATLWPIASMLLRGVTPVGTDVTAVLPACKLAGLVLLVRLTVSTSRQVLWCIRLIIGGAVGIAATALLQSLNVGPVATALDTWFPAWPEELDRGTTTLSNAFATGDYILIGLTLLVTSGIRGLVGRGTRIGAGLMLAIGLFAAGQFSTWLGAILIGVLLVWRIPAMRTSALRFAPVVAIALVISAQAVLGRLAEFSTGSAPQSWLVRWDNLSHLYLPELFGHAGFLIGVSPNSVVVPPDTWRSVVYLESGYLQFLWIGGLPLLVGFVLLSRAVLGWAGRLGSRTDGVGACAQALGIVWWLVLFLTLFDAHLFLRGPSDLLFMLIGIVSGTAVEERPDDHTD